MHGIPVIPYGTEGRGAVIAVRSLQCAVFPAKNIEVVRTAPEVEQALDALIFVFDSCTFDDNRKSGARFHLPQQRRAARIKCQHTDVRRYAVRVPGPHAERGSTSPYGAAARGRTALILQDRRSLPGSFRGAQLRKAENAAPPAASGTAAKSSGVFSPQPREIRRSQSLRRDKAASGLIRTARRISHTAPGTRPARLSPARRSARSSDAPPAPSWISSLRAGTGV